MITLPYSLVIEATDEPDYFGFYSPELEGFTGIGSLHRRLSLQGELGYGRSHATAASARLAGAHAQSQPDNRDSERAETATRVTAEEQSIFLRFLL
jgi:hypothetical protein